MADFLPINKKDMEKICCQMNGVLYFLRRIVLNLLFFFPQGQFL